MNRKTLLTKLTYKTLFIPEPVVSKLFGTNHAEVKLYHKFEVTKPEKLLAFFYPELEQDSEFSDFFEQAVFDAFETYVRQTPIFKINPYDLGLTYVPEEKF